MQQRRIRILLGLLMVGAAVWVYRREAAVLERAVELLCAAQPVELRVQAVELAAGPGVGQYEVLVHTRAADGRPIGGRRVEAVARYATLRAARVHQQQYTVGESLAGWYAPAHPEDAFLHRTVFFHWALLPALALGLGGLGVWLALGSVRFRMGGVACAVIWLLPIPLCFVRYLQLPGSSVVLASLGIAGAVLAAGLALLPCWLLQRWRRV